MCLLPLLSSTSMPLISAALAPSCSAIGFPLGLILIVFCGGDLFTGNCFYSLVAWLEGELGSSCAVPVAATSGRMWQHRA